MRLILSDDIKKTIDSFEPYLVFKEDEGMVFKPDTPDEIKEQYREIHRQIDEMKHGEI